MRSFTSAMVIGAAALLGACSVGSDAAIEMSGREFVPDAVTVPTGETVTFVNESREAHAVAAYEGSLPDGAAYFASGGSSSEAEARSDVAAGLLKPGETFEVTFEVAGTYRYFCTPHEAEGMQGVVVVEGRPNGP